LSPEAVRRNEQNCSSGFGKVAATTEQQYLGRELPVALKGSKWRKQSSGMLFTNDRKVSFVDHQLSEHYQARRL
jgi:hypothetical protein